MQQRGRGVGGKQERTGKTKKNPHIWSLLETLQEPRGGGQNAIAGAESKDARTYLDANIDSLQEPIGGRSVLAFSGVKTC